MKKIRVLLLAAAIIIGVSGAYANRFDPTCSDQPQYVRVGLYYFPAGTFGVTYICWGSVGTCTYYMASPGNPYSFTPCRQGVYFQIYY